MIDHLIIQLTYPEFHFETEVEVDSLTGLQRYKGDYKFYLGNNFQLELRLRFFSVSVTFNLCNLGYVCSAKNFSS